MNSGYNSDREHVSLAGHGHQRGGRLVKVADTLMARSYGQLLGFTKVDGRCQSGDRLFLNAHIMKIPWRWHNSHVGTTPETYN